MKFIGRYWWEPESKAQEEALRRFRETGGQPPAGVRLLGRWTRADFMGGVVLLESDDAKALTEFSLRWSDVMNLELVPVLEDQELVEALEKAGR